MERASPGRTLLDAYADAVPDETRLEQNVRAVADCLVRRHGFALTPGDLETIARAQRAFFDAGPELRYAYPHRVYPTYAELMVETDNRGEPRSYLSSEEAFLEVKRLEEKNLIVPVVGDFAGGKALRAVGVYLRRHRATVNVFYTSNVEFYLRETGGLPRFFDNVAALPVDRDSIFIRASFTDEPAMRVDAIGEPRTSIDEPDDPFPDLRIHLIAGRDVSPEAGGPGCPAAPGLPRFGCDRRAVARDERRRLPLLIALVEDVCDVVKQGDRGRRRPIRWPRHCDLLPPRFPPIPGRVGHEPVQRRARIGVALNFVEGGNGSIQPRAPVLEQRAMRLESDRTALQYQLDRCQREPERLERQDALICWRSAKA